MVFYDHRPFFEAVSRRISTKYKIIKMDLLGQPLSRSHVSRFSGVSPPSLKPLHDDTHHSLEAVDGVRLVWCDVVLVPPKHIHPTPTFVQILAGQ